MSFKHRTNSPPHVPPKASQLRHQPLPFPDLLDELLSETAARGIHARSIQPSLPSIEEDSMPNGPPIDPSLDDISPSSQAQRQYPIRGHTSLS
jgi:hypothetical protein